MPNDLSDSGRSPAATFDSISAEASRPPSRRTFTAALLAAPFIITQSRTAEAAPRKLRLYHTHTHETLVMDYRPRGDYDADELAEISRFLRDFRTGDVHPVDPRILATLYRVQQVTRSRGVYQIISGYRSAKTNEMLRGKSADSGVAKKSLHMLGDAIDVRLTDVPTRHMRRAAVSLRLGGVGYYPKSDFVHLDTGRVRTW